MNVVYDTELVTTDVSITSTVRTCQIIKSALALGVIMFGATTLTMTKPPQAGLIHWIMLGQAVVLIIARWMIPGMIVARQRTAIRQGTWKLARPPNSVAISTDTGKLLMAYQTQMIVGAALLEGAAFSNLVAFLLEGQWLSLGAAAVMLAVMMMDFPTVRSVGGWLERQQRIMEEERMLSGLSR